MYNSDTWKSVTGHMHAQSSRVQGKCCSLGFAALSQCQESFYCCCSIAVHNHMFTGQQRYAGSQQRHQHGLWQLAPEGCYKFEGVCFQDRASIHLRVLKLRKNLAAHMTKQTAQNKRLSLSGWMLDLCTIHVHTYALGAWLQVGVRQHPQRLS